MALVQLSPSVSIVETDLSNVVPAVAATPGGFVGTFQWGPTLEPTLIGSENDLVSVFGKPNDDTAQSFFTAANFLQYGSSLFVVRVATSGMRNATAAGAGVLIKNTDDYESNYADGQASGLGEFAGKYPGVFGNSVKVSMADNASFAKNLTGTVTCTTSSPNLTGVSTVFATELAVGDFVYNSAGALIGKVKTITSATAVVLEANAFVAVTGAAINAKWEYASFFPSAPGTSDYAALRAGSKDELHVVVVDADGKLSGQVGQILEKYQFLSKAIDAKGAQGASIYYVNVLKNQSKFIYWLDHPTAVSDWGSTAESGATFDTLAKNYTVRLQSGADDNTATDGELIVGYDLLADDQRFDISLIPTGKVSETVATYVIQSVAETRHDCVVFVSPVEVSTGNILIGSDQTVLDKTIAFRNALPSTSYGVLDSGFKYQYDKYNDKFRYVPLNGDTAGLCARTDLIADPWFSPAGYNRGSIKNVTKLAFNPTKSQRDQLYSKNINPVVSIVGQGTVLFGDKTLQTKPSAFDRINVRRCAIVLEKSIATASKYVLFELNDSFTRAQFKALVEPFLRDVKGRRGLIDYLLICDESINTPQVIDNNEFRADVYLKFSRSINFITLNFIATRTGASFQEIAGANS